MTHSQDSQRSRRTRRQFIAATLALLISIGWARPVSAAEPTRTPTFTRTRTFTRTPVRTPMVTPTPTETETPTPTATPARPGKIAVGEVSALAIDPGTPTTLYAGTGCSGVFKSLDGGDTWSAVNAGLSYDGHTANVNTLAINPATPTTLYAGGYGVYRSTDGGGSWSAVNAGLSGSYPYDILGVSALTIDPATQTTLNGCGG